MERRAAPIEQIIQAVSEAPGCLLEDLAPACPGLTWNQIFLAVDRLSRTGEVLLNQSGAGTYRLRLPGQARRRPGGASSVQPNGLDGHLRRDGRI